MKEQEAKQKGKPKGKPQKEQKQASKQKEKQMTMKMLIQKMVPYTSAVYAEHVFRELAFDSNTKVSLETIDKHMDILIQAAHRLRDLVKDMEQN